MLLVFQLKDVRHGTLSELDFAGNAGARYEYSMIDILRALDRV
jgi:hypothetical protein